MTTLSLEDKNNLLETARWGKFLGIIGFIFSGLIVLGALTFMSGMGFATDEIYPSIGGGIGFLYLLMSLVYILPSLYVYRFSVRMQDGIRNKKPDQCSSAYSNLKKLFVFMGVLIIIVLGLYAFIILGVLAGGAMGGML